MIFAKKEFFPGAMQLQTEAKKRQDKEEAQTKQRQKAREEKTKQQARKQQAEVKKKQDEEEEKQAQEKQQVREEKEKKQKTLKEEVKNLHRFPGSLSEFCDFMGEKFTVMNTGTNKYFVNVDNNHHKNAYGHKYDDLRDWLFLEKLMNEGLCGVVRYVPLIRTSSKGWFFGGYGIPVKMIQKSTENDSKIN